jgi:Leucine Rich repeat
MSFEDFLEKLKTNNQFITEVVLDELSDQQLVLLADALEGNTQVNTLSLKSCKKTKIAQNIARMLKTNKFIHSLNLESNGIDETGIGLICLGLANNHSIRYLNIRDNKIGNNGLILLSFILESNKLIQHLDIGGNRIGDKGIQVLCESLKNNTSLQTLNLGCNDMSEDGMQSLQSLLQCNDTITTLDFFLDYYYQWNLGKNSIEPLLENNRIIAEKRRLLS